MADRKTPMRDGEMLVLPVAASTKVEAGHMIALGADGYAVPAADAVGLTVMGRAEETVDNTDGADGDLYVAVQRKKAFAYANSVANAVDVSHVGGNVYVEDSETVASAGGSNNIVAGKCLGVGSDGVWVEIA